MITVYKYPIPVTDEFRIELPADYRILSAQAQKNEPFLWALVDTETKPISVPFVLKGTGHPFTEDQAEAYCDLEHVSSFQLYEGAIVFHLFLDVRG